MTSAVDAAAVPPSSTPNPVTNGVSTQHYAIHPRRVVEYLCALLEAALGATQDEFNAPGSILSESMRGTVETRCLRFASDTVPALYIQKEIVPISSVENGTGEQRKPARDVVLGA